MYEFNFENFTFDEDADIEENYPIKEPKKLPKGNFIEISPTSDFKYLSILAKNKYTLNLKKYWKDIDITFENIISAFTFIKYIYVQEEEPEIEIVLEENPNINLQRYLTLPNNKYWEKHKEQILEELMIEFFSKSNNSKLCSSLLKLGEIDGYQFLDTNLIDIFLDERIDLIKIYDKVKESPLLDW